jgi:AcrR family transcriptional regulator
VFRRHGLADTTLEAIAAEAGILRPHLYRYFRDKSALVSAVVAAETAEINERRRALVARERGFANRVVRALELAVEIVHGDPFWSTLAAPGNVPYTAYAAARDPALVASNVEFWEPIFDDALAAGELRVDLDREELLTWLLGLQFLFLERREIFPQVGDVGRYVRLFVVPALVPAGAAAPRSRSGRSARPSRAAADQLAADEPTGARARGRSR